MNQINLANEDNFVKYNGIYGDTSTKAWKSGGQITRVYPVLIKAGSVISFGNISQSSRHGISDSVEPVVGEPLSIAADGTYKTITTTKDGYLYICHPATTGYHPTRDELIAENCYFTITEP